jgi:Spy/CpxP family protein refolding chaperone
MTGCRVFALVTVLACLTPNVAAAQGFKWWQSDQFKTEFALTPDQVTRLEGVFRDLLPRMTTEMEELDRLEKKLSEVIRGGTANEADVMKQVDVVEATRSTLSRTRTMMTYRMYRILTPEQRVKMKAQHDKWEEERRQGRRRH